MTNTSVAAVDLSAFIPADTAILDVVARGTGAKIGWKITFAGPGHEKTIAWNEARAREGLQKSRQIEIAQINGRNYKPEEKTVEETRRDNVRWVVARIIDWTPVTLEPGGKPIAFSEQAAVNLFVDPRFGWIYAQCLEFLGAEQSFTQASAQA